MQLAWSHGKSQCSQINTMSSRKVTGMSQVQTMVAWIKLMPFSSSVIKVTEESVCPGNAPPVSLPMSSSHALACGPLLLRNKRFHHPSLDFGPIE